MGHISVHPSYPTQPRIRTSSRHREDIPLPMWCANKRFNMCKKKLWKMMLKARDKCGENVKCIARKFSGRIGKCKPCVCRAVYTFGPRVFSNKITIELLLELDCYA